MSFTSFRFLIFVFVTAMVYFVMPCRYRWCALLTASYVFYLLSSPRTFVFMLFTTVTTFVGGGIIGWYEEEYRALLDREKGQLDRTQKKILKEQTHKKKRRVMVLVLLMNFGILAFIKYFRVYINLLAVRMGITWLQFDADYLIPLGISFYTFQSLGYLIDVYRGKYKPDKNIAKFALFVSYFPQIIQGPISRHNQLAEQLYEGHSFDYERVKFGIQLILWGFFKKLVIADRIGILVDQVFDNYAQYSGFYYLVAVFGYTIQIYADFSGGMEIARGVSQILGINLVLNFERPYFAISIPDFWRRWHITLGSWCKDYIFYPISLSKNFAKLGKKSKKLLGDRLGKMMPVILAQLITFTIIGLWHGASVRFIAYGMYQAVFILGGMIFEPQLVRLTNILRINTKAFGWKLFQIIRTFVIVMVGRFFSRGLSFLVAIHMMKNMFVFNPEVLFGGEIFALGLTRHDFFLLAICLCFWIIISIIQECGYSVRELIAKQNILCRWIIYFVGIWSVLIFGVYGMGYDASLFIYRGF